MLRFGFWLLCLIWVIIAVSSASFFLFRDTFQEHDLLWMILTAIVMSVWAFLLCLFGEEIRQVDHFTAIDD